MFQISNRNFKPKNLIKKTEKTKSEISNRKNQIRNFKPKKPNPKTLNYFVE